VSSRTPRALGLQDAAHPLGVAGQGAGLGGLGRHQQPVGHPAGRLDQAGGGQVLLAQHHPRREGLEAGAPVRLGGDQPGDAQARIAQQQVLPHPQPQGVGDGRIHPPGRARAHRPGAAPPRPVHQAQAAAQRVVGAHRLDRHQPGGTALGRIGPRHAGKDGVAAHGQAGLAGLRGQLGRQRLVAPHHQVAAQQLGRIALQPALQPVGEEAHRGQRRHRQHHRRQHQAQLAGAEVQPQLARRQAPQARRDGGRHRARRGGVGQGGRRLGGLHGRDGTRSP
jgi:hypothetical protein